MTQLEPQAAYALWAAHYPPTAHNALMEIEESAVLSLVPLLQGAVALDAGCGTGRYRTLLSARGARVHGIDRSFAMISHAAPASRAVGDLHALPLATAAFDLVLCALVLNDVAALHPVMHEFARVLRPGGVLVTSVIHPRGADAQWTRTFEAAGGTWSLPACWHSFTDHARACGSAGLRVEQRLEPELPGRGPVALVVRACKS
jgi:malonyl-CoA O-methyltransferase